MEVRDEVFTAEGWLKHGGGAQYLTNQAALIICGGARKSVSTVRVRSGNAATSSCATPGAPSNDAAGQVLHPTPRALSNSNAFNKFPVRYQIQTS